MNRPDPALLRLILFVGGLVGAVVILIVFRRIFLPLLVGLGIAYLLDPAVTWLQARGRSRVFGAVVITGLLLVMAAGMVLYVVPAMGGQLRRLGGRLPEYSERLAEQARPWLERIQARYPEEIQSLQERAVEAARENWPRLASSVGRWVGELFGNLLDLVLVLLNLIFIPVFAFYLLVDFPEFKRGATGLVPLPYREVVVARVREVDQAVASFLRGQLTIALILAVINAAGLVILQVPLGLVIGAVAGLANMIPYMAVVVGLIPALLLCWAEHQSWLRLVGVGAVFGGAQLLEGTFLSPRILGRSVNLHPVWILLAIIVGGSLFGFFGMLIAVPVAAATHVFVRHWVEAYRSSRIYTGEAPAEGGGGGSGGDRRGGS